MLQFQNIFKTSVCLTYILKQNILHGVTRDTVSEHQYVSHVYWKRIFYINWHVIQIQNINMTHVYIEKEYCTWSDMQDSFRTSVYLTCILKENVVMNGVTRYAVSANQYVSQVYWKNVLHGVTCNRLSEYYCVSHEYWNRKLYIEWNVIQFKNFIISHMYIETEYCTLCDAWYNIRISVWLTCILKENIVHGVTGDSELEH